MSQKQKNKKIKTPTQKETGGNFAKVIMCVITGTNASSILAIPIRQDIGIDVGKKCLKSTYSTKNVWMEMMVRKI